MSHFKSDGSDHIKSLILSAEKKVLGTNKNWDDETKYLTVEDLPKTRDDIKWKEIRKEYNLELAEFYAFKYAYCIPGMF